jgi:uncharacterized protein (DUF362 family)
VDLESGIRYPVSGIRHLEGWSDRLNLNLMNDEQLPVVDAYRAVGRRELLRQWLPPAVAGMALAGLGLGFSNRPGRHQPPSLESLPRPRDWRFNPDAPGALATACGEGPTANLRHALASLGGINAFVKPGERIAIKPNCAWDRSPEQAANTDPELIGELVRQCLSAGAASVTVLDNSCHDPGRAFTRSGIEKAARDAGGATAHQRNAGTVKLDLGGTILGPWKVLKPIAEADRVINVPVVKHHSLSRATLGMKNWFGAVVGRRPNLHQRIAQVCAELGSAFRPTLTIIDATRILTGGGPTGGSLALVNPADCIAVATDPVAADAWGASLMDLGPEQLPHIAIAARLGLGTADWKSVEVET